LNHSNSKSVSFIKSAVNQGENLSEFFRIERGFRQVDPLSLFIHTMF
jgi:hypothetical protein